MLELKETDHSYYCECWEGDRTTEYESWDEFLATDGKNDWDMNLLFRYDIDTDEEGHLRLQLHHALQRHGVQLWHAVIHNIEQDDMPSINQYLKDRYEFLKELWKEIEGDCK